jgi:hypothetical protein
MTTQWRRALMQGAWRIEVAHHHASLREQWVWSGSARRESRNNRRGSRSSVQYSVRMKTTLMIASVIVVLVACSNPPEASCYRVFESVVTENNGRFLMKVPCPPGQRGVITTGP